MATPQLPELTPKQVVELKDALLANADRLLSAAGSVLESGSTGLAKSLAILGLEESGKAIAIHQRQVGIAHEEEGAPFVNDWLQKLWREHFKKLRLVHDFLVDEEYWFGSEPSDPEENAVLLGSIDSWAHSHNVLKQKGFYVDVSPEGASVSPECDTDAAPLAAVIERVHQIGWQLRLGEHIEASLQDSMGPVAPASEEEIEDMRALFGDTLDAQMLNEILDSARVGTNGIALRNDMYRLHLRHAGTSPFENMGKPGFEAETRELHRLAKEVHGTTPEDEPGVGPTPPTD
ncbi:AbiV family abortive infection protein [Cryobacterium sp. N22]|uniref:AbiV family abortive infection protein n=1 Tax=Cryobacterium sp. N22 TaxID=2048290 RepID=UPI000CE4C5F2|nr:AbiV family abortive infection protein [Cryobacterium sp. N22]